jgi:hypothetical protein
MRSQLIAAAVFKDMQHREYQTLKSSSPGAVYTYVEKAREVFQNIFNQHNYSHFIIANSTRNPPMRWGIGPFTYDSLPVEFPDIQTS